MVSRAGLVAVRGIENTQVIDFNYSSFGNIWEILKQIGESCIRMSNLSFPSIHNSRLCFGVARRQEPIPARRLLAVGGFDFLDCGESAHGFVIFRSATGLPSTCSRPERRPASLGFHPGSLISTFDAIRRNPRKAKTGSLIMNARSTDITKKRQRAGRLGGRKRSGRKATAVRANAAKDRRVQTPAE